MLFVLDRDGVINFDSDHYIKSPDEWIPIPGSLEAIALLTTSHHHMVIATNQSGVNRGLFSLDQLQKIHEKMIRAIESAGGKIEKIYFCPHRPDENCHCRKPKLGMFEQIQRDFQIKSNEIIYVGDSLKDDEVAKTIGCKFFLVRTGNGEKTEQALQDFPKQKIFDDLLSFVKYFIAQ